MAASGNDAKTPEVIPFLPAPRPQSSLLLRRAEGQEFQALILAARYGNVHRYIIWLQNRELQARNRRSPAYFPIAHGPCPL
jgi:hypothetical protein